MRMLPLLNQDADMSDDMWVGLQCFSALHGRGSATEEDVRKFLEERYDRPDLARDFTTDLLVPHPEDAR